MERTLYAVDELSGFVMACAYVRPQGIDGLTPKSIKKKMKTPAFAAAVDRDAMREGAELLGIDFDEHLTFVVAALEPHAEELGLAGAVNETISQPESTSTASALTRSRPLPQTITSRAPSRALMRSAPDAP